MKTIILGGYSHKNKEWADTVAQKLGGEVFEWQHWNNPTVRFSEKAEAKNITNEIGEDEVNIIAKSIGTLVLVTLLPNIKINKVILCGVPVNDLNEDNKIAYKVLSDFDATKMIVFQNSEDEHGSFEEVRRFLTQYNPNIQIIEKPGSTHDYPYYEEFEEFLKS